MGLASWFARSVASSAVGSCAATRDEHATLSHPTIVAAARARSLMGARPAKRVPLGGSRGAARFHATSATSAFGAAGVTAPA